MFNIVLFYNQFKPSHSNHYILGKLNAKAVCSVTL